MMRMTIMMMMMMSIMMMMMMMMMTMTDYLVTLAWTECWTGRLQCSERSGRKKPQWCSNLGQCGGNTGGGRWTILGQTCFDGRRLEFCKDLTFAICWFDRQGTSSQYQYCYLDLVFWYCQFNQFNTNSEAAMMSMIWFCWCDNNEYEYSSSITWTRLQ